MMRPSLAAIFLAFCRLGSTAFGGPAMLPFLRRMVVDDKGWLSPDDFRTGLSLCQAIPGATLMQLSAFTGLRLRGLAGGLAAYVGFGLPAFLLITGLAVAYSRFHSTALAQGVLAGLKVVVVALVAFAAWDFLQRFTTSPRARVLAGVAALLFLAGVGPVPIILGALLAGSIALHVPDPPACPAPPPAKPRTTLAPVAACLLALALLAAFSRPLFDLAVSMAKVDFFAFGGFGAFPVMLHEVVEVRGWLDKSTFMDGIALGQVTPGPILLTAAFVGYLLAGFPGAVVGGVAVFAPSFILLPLAEPQCDRLLASRSVRRAMAGSLASLGGLLVAVGIGFAQAVTWTPGALLLLAATGLALWRRVDVVWIVLAGALASALELV